jgi:phosphoglycolate phosphatase-like HAD superfamily hydrolase
VTLLADLLPVEIPPHWLTSTPPDLPAPLAPLSGPTPGVVFDIDGTLAAGSSDHLTALGDAAREVLGVAATFTLAGEKPYLNDHLVAGWVDAQCIALLAETSGHRLDDVMEDFLASYTAHYEHALRHGASAGHLLPGVADMLATLADHDIVLGLATGNASPIAKAKLTVLGIADYFTFSPTHGFGDRHPDRSAVGRAAIASLAATGQVYLVGDTTSDIRSARDNDAIAVGVCTGAATAAELLQARAHVDLVGYLGLLPGRWFPRPTPGIPSAADGWFDRLD